MPDTVVLSTAILDASSLPCGKFLSKHDRHTAVPAWRLLSRQQHHRGAVSGRIILRITKYASSVSAKQLLPTQRNHTHRMSRQKSHRFIQCQRRGVLRVPSGDVCKINDGMRDMPFQSLLSRQHHTADRVSVADECDGVDLRKGV